MIVFKIIALTKKIWKTLSIWAFWHTPKKISPNKLSRSLNDSCWMSFFESFLRKKGEIWVRLLCKKKKENLSWGKCWKERPCDQNWLWIDSRLMKICNVSLVGLATSTKDILLPVNWPEPLAKWSGVKQPSNFFSSLFPSTKKAFIKVHEWQSLF